MNKPLLCLTASLLTSAVPALSHADSPYFSLKDGDGFKRFSVSAGWLHVMPQGKGNPLQTNTSVSEGTQSTVGDVSKNAVLDSAVESSNPILYNLIKLWPSNDLPGAITGTATINGLSDWTSEGTGLEAQDVDTLGLMGSYYFTDHLSIEMKAGIPPRVDIKGIGQVFAPLRGRDEISPGIGLDLNKDIPITNLSGPSKAASARAWTPAIELQYQFGKSGVNKFRPYLGIGVMYAYFNDLKLDPGIESDLIAAGHMIQNIHDNKAGQSLDNKTSSADPRVKLEAEDAWAPMVTAGFTYDFNPNWFAVASVSYAKLGGDSTIEVIDNNTGNQLIHSKTKIDIDPIMTYMGIGYRF
ncbi:OmpW/AlkL family protein [Acinetobacter sp. WZC-1]|uniref:OmpW/AlkL family protein n=1 Tax=Acinetobacter sp. WZC-1 TaxID=3459034 RepID=UPI00403DC44E